MRFHRTLRTSLHALRRNVLRAFLTTLGIIIGIASVIAMMEVGNGSSAAIQKTIASMGANVLLIFPGATASTGVSYGAGTQVSLTPGDCDAIIRECPEVRAAAPVVHVRTQVVYGHRNWVPGVIYGTTPAFLTVRDWTNPSQGYIFTDREVRNSSKVCMIGQTLVRELFQNESPIGKEVRIKNVAFKVIGVLSPKGANMMGMDQDDLLIAPWTTIKYRVSGTSAQVVNQSAAAIASATTINTLSDLYPSGSLNLYDTPSASQQADTPLPVRFVNVDEIRVSAATTDSIPQAIREITELLRERHHIPPEAADDFDVRDLTEMMSALTRTTALMTTLLLCVACISLIVGGVGIMNIMLVSVTERTREIGLRMAVGARARDILRQFLTEAVVLCLAGGAMGILLGIGVSFLVTLLLKWPTVSSPTAVCAAVIVSATVGITFGFYPAYKASRLDPIEALRYE
jgi:ABC-type antimicrobial peptide transport system permease subunit